MPFRLLDGLRPGESELREYRLFDLVGTSTMEDSKETLSTKRCLNLVPITREKVCPVTFAFLVLDLARYDLRFFYGLQHFYY